MYLVPEHPRVQVNDELCGRIIRSVPVCLDTQVKRGALLSIDHHLVVSWVRWWGRMLDRPSKPEHVVRVAEVFNS